MYELTKEQMEELKKLTGTSFKLNIKQRGFEVAKDFENEGINLPKRSTKKAAGYDFEASEDVVVPSIWKQLVKNLRPSHNFPTVNLKDPSKVLKPTLVPTGIKSYMQGNEYLKLVARSSSFKNFGLLMTNGVGIIDSDYYENQGNDGHIMFQFINFKFHDVTIKKGDRIGQGIFTQFLMADGDNGQFGEERVGGHGSTGA